MAENQDKAVAYTKAFVNALSGAAEEMSGMLNAPDIREKEPESFGNLRRTVTGMMAMGEDCTPQEIQDHLEGLRNAAGKSISELRDNNMEHGSVHMILAKGLAEFAEAQHAAFQKHSQNLLQPDQPINEQELEKKTAVRMKVSLDNLQKETQQNMREKHERVYKAAENQGPSKSSASIGKR